MLSSRTAQEMADMPHDIEPGITREEGKYLAREPLSNLCKCAVGMHTLLNTVGFTVLGHHDCSRSRPVGKTARGGPARLQGQHVSSGKSVTCPVCIRHTVNLQPLSVGMAPSITDSLTNVCCEEQNSTLILIVEDLASRCRPD